MKDGGRNTFATRYHTIVGQEGDLDMQNTINPVIFNILGNIKNKKVLDLACGNGYFSFLLEQKGAKVTGIDISLKLISFAKEASKKLKSKNEFLVSDAANLKILKDKKFDVIVSNMAFMDIQDIEGTIKECAKHVTKKGLLILSLSNPIYGVSKRIFAKKENKYYLQIEKYGTATSIKNTNFGTIFHHRPISFYLNALLNNGFQLTKYQEICTPYHQGKLTKDKALIAYKKEFPSFLIIEAKKI